MTSTLNDVTDVLVIAAFVGALLFVLRYLRTRWFSTPMGRHVMGFMVGLALILGLAAATTLWGEFANRNVIRFLTYAVINGIVWWRVGMLFEGQRVIRTRGRRAKPKEEEIR